MDYSSRTGVNAAARSYPLRNVSRAELNLTGQRKGGKKNRRKKRGYPSSRPLSRGALSNRPALRVFHYTDTYCPRYVAGESAIHDAQSERPFFIFIYRRSPSLWPQAPAARFIAWQFDVYRVTTTLLRRRSRFISSLKFRRHSRLSGSTRPSFAKFSLLFLNSLHCRYRPPRFVYANSENRLFKFFLTAFELQASFSMFFPLSAGTNFTDVNSSFFHVRY